MKNSLLLVLLISALFGTLSSCEKNDPDQNLKDLLVGEWEWIKYDPGLGGEIITPDSLGITKSLLIDETTYSVFINDTLQSSSPYTIGHGANSHFSWDEIRLSSGEIYVFQVGATSLKLSPLFPFDSDCYERK